MSGGIVLLANARLPSQRAQSLQVVQMAAAFARAGVETTLLHARRRNTPPLPVGQDLWSYYAVAPGPRPSVRAVPSTDWIDRAPRALQYVPARLQELTFARNAARAVERELPDARVLAREAESALWLVRRGHAAVFLEIHRVPGGRLRRRWLCEAAAGSRGVIAISRGVAEDLRALGVAEEKLRVEHDGFEAARFASLPSRSEARARLGLAPDEPVAVYTGGLLAWKGADLVVDAARELPRVRFVIAGGMDADVERLRARAAGLANVEIAGFQPPERVPLYLSAADVGLVPNRSAPPISARYTSPLKVFEAMAAGLPLVASDLPSLRELLTDERDALLVAPDDAEALAAGIGRLLGDPALRRALGERLAARAGKHTWDARARRILAWMEAQAQGM